MSKVSALLRTASVILAFAIIVSGVNSAIATTDGMEKIARHGVADLLMERYILAD